MFRDSKHGTIQCTLTYLSTIADITLCSIGLRVNDCSPTALLSCSYSFERAMVLIRLVFEVKFGVFVTEVEARPGSTATLSLAYL